MKSLGLCDNLNACEENWGGKEEGIGQPISIKNQQHAGLSPPRGMKAKADRKENYKKKKTDKNL